jgi:hypothetical protein
MFQLQKCTIFIFCHFFISQIKNKFVHKTYISLVVYKNYEGDV